MTVSERALESELLLHPWFQDTIPGIIRILYTLMITITSQHVF